MAIKIVSSIFLFTFTSPLDNHKTEYILGRGTETATSEHSTGIVFDDPLDKNAVKAWNKAFESRSILRMYFYSPSSEERFFSCDIIPGSPLEQRDDDSRFTADYQPGDVGTVYFDHRKFPQAAER